MSYIRHKAEESLEDYLETILILSSRLSVVRSIDVATELNFSNYERHTLLTDWLVHLGVDPVIAAGDACKMEHDITPESYEAMKKCILSILGRG
ncbi:MAG: metal-dependent transcriptional regulator [Lachnospiraceae bacterium]|nr:metal-dependent transcriptional regulator [Lachnospiraceae bacterium]